MPYGNTISGSLIARLVRLGDWNNPIVVSSNGGLEKTKLEATMLPYFNAYN